MSKVDFFSEDNILRTAGLESRKSKKGDGVNAILGLLQKLRAVQDDIEATADAQDITENRQACENVAQAIEEHSEKLLDIVRGGIRSIRTKEPVPGVESEGEGELDIDKGLTSTPVLPSTPTPIM